MPRTGLAGHPCQGSDWRCDRFFPAQFQRRLARDRLGIEADVIDGGQLVALACPADLAERLHAYAAEPPSD